ncbi:hypothetical protein HYDPIDRAFT_41624 [Hydnomerulius pinastri MD-312]|uniref:F-box domain-containing protein n=1 Tax=Hydnomerulius pinastri MD-312 TaxID=994086 RepID=A0A0C9W742_9AGAM|nr:hypothetical protein HYDPIDRAFT_41624 [Hydnomerulius pinastri MD-312]
MTHGRRTLTDLPNELLFEIFTDVSCSTQVSLCTVSSTIHAIATLVLYRTVVAQDSARLVKVCKTLATNAIAGQAVRHLFVLVNERTLARVRLGAGRSLYMSAFCRIIERALLNMPNVVSITTLDSTIDGIVLGRCTFPGLQVFYSSFEDGAATAAFLRRHPDIRTLQLPRGLVDEGDALRDIRLHRLECLSLSSNLLYLLSARPPLSSLYIYWDPNDANFDEKFAQVAQSCPSVEELKVYQFDWSLPLISAIFTNLKGIKSLTIVNTGIRNPGLRKGFIKSTKDMLAQSTQLHRIAFESVFGVPADPSHHYVDRWFEAAMMLGEACPSLQTCSFPSDITFFRLPDDDIWIPELWRSCGLDWLKAVFDVADEEDHPIDNIDGSLRYALRTFADSDGELDLGGFKMFKMPEMRKAIDVITLMGAGNLSIGQGLA